MGTQLVQNEGQNAWQMSQVDWVKLLTHPTELSRVIAGFLASDVPQHVLAAGRIIQAARNHQCFKQVGIELNLLKEKGKIKDDCLDRPSAQSSLFDLLQMIDSETPDDNKFNAVKAIFLYSLKDAIDERERILAYELQRVCSKLTSGELLVLKAAFEIHTGKNLRPYGGGMSLNVDSADQWRQYVSFQIGHNDLRLVELHEKRLTEFKLMCEWKFNHENKVIGVQDFCLTSLGKNLCEFIFKGNDLLG